MRVLIWLGFILLVIVAIRKSIRIAMSKNNRATTATHQAPATEKPMETMVCCAHCQVYIPASEAIIKDEMSYCSVEHAQQK